MGSGKQRIRDAQRGEHPQPSSHASGFRIVNLTVSAAFWEVNLIEIWSLASGRWATSLFFSSLSIAYSQLIDYQVFYYHI